MRKKVFLSLMLAALFGGGVAAFADEQWVTLDVSPGELPARLYDTLGDDLNALEYLKVTGQVDTLDLRNMSRFKRLRKLDLGDLKINGGAIPQRMCERSDSLREVILPADVTRIGEWAFSSNYELRKVTFAAESQIEEVGMGAFQLAQKLEELYIPNVRRLGGSVFWGCVNFDPSYMRGLHTDNYHNFSSSGITEAPEGMFADDIKTMTNFFSSCKELKSVYVPDGVTDISGICEGCENLESIRIGNSVTTIRNYAFRGTKITSLDLPASVIFMHANSISNCPNLKHITCRALLPPNTERVVLNNGYYGTTNVGSMVLTVSKAARSHYYESQSLWGQIQLDNPIDVAYDDIFVYVPQALHLNADTEGVFASDTKMEITYDYDNAAQLLVDGDGTLNLSHLTIDRAYGMEGYYQPSGKSQWVSLLNKAPNLSADNITFATCYKQNDWQYIVMPFDIAPKDIVLPEYSHVLFKEYDGSERAAGNPQSVWKPVANDAVMTAGKPYALFVINTEVTNDGWNINYENIKMEANRSQNCNNLFKMDGAIYPVEQYDAEFAFDRSWNNLGNPYFCYYDIRSLLDQDGNQITTPVLVWNGSAFMAYSPLDDNFAFAPYQGFFMQAPAGVTKVKFVPEARYLYSDARNAGLRAPAANPNRNVFNFNLLSGENSVNRARVVLNEAASADYEPGRDVAKFFEGDVAKVYVSGNAKYEICERPLADGNAMLGVNVNEAGEYTLHLDGSFAKGWQVKLTDLLTGDEVELTETDYVFRAEEGGNDTRFSLLFSPAREESDWTVFTLEKPGDLHAACTADPNLALSITKLKVIGQMNHDDSYRISQMQNLVKVDLSDAHYQDERVRDRQFYRFEALEEVVLPPSTEIIRASAFEGCKKLTRFECPAELYYIDYSAFYNCETLNEVIFNDKLRVIGRQAFYNTALTHIVLPQTMTNIQGGAFNTRDSRSLVSIECKSLLPPDYVCEGWDGGGQYYGDPEYQSYVQQVQITVPAVAYNAYRNHKGWGEHLIMRPKDMTFNTIVSDRYHSLEVTDEVASKIAPTASLQLMGLTNYSDYAGYDWYNGRGQITFTGDAALNFHNVEWRFRHHYNHGTSYFENRPAEASVICENPNISATGMTATMIAEPHYWHYISLPFDAKVGDIEIPETNFIAVRTYDGAARAEGDLDSAWVNLGEDDVMKAGVGYIVFVHDVEPNRGRQTIRFRGNSTALNSKMFTTEEQALDLKDYPSDVDANRSWNFVTNPYSAYYDISCLTDDEGNTPTTPITYRHHSSYRACSPIDDNLILHPNEPIFIQKPANGTIHFPLEGMMHYDEALQQPENPGFYKPAANGVDRNVFNFDVMQGDEMIDRARIVINEAALPTYETWCDASKFVDASSTLPQLYVAGDCMYAICERPMAEGSAQLGFAGSAMGSYTLSLTGRHQAGWQVWLTDLANGTTVDLASADYQFTLTGNDTNRFKVRFDNSGVSGIEASKIVSDNIVVTDVAGMVIYRGPRAEFRAPGSGVYIISDGVNTNKAFFNK